LRRNPNSGVAPKARKAWWAVALTPGPAPLISMAVIMLLMMLP